MRKLDVAITRLYFGGVTSRALVILGLSIGCATTKPTTTASGTTTDPQPDRCQETPNALEAAQQLAEVGDVEGSIAHYRCALQLDPKQTNVRIELAAQLISASAWSDAQAELQKVLAETQPDFRIRSLMASALEGQGQLKAAADELARAADETKTSAVLYRRAADLYERAGDASLADRLDRRADEIDPPPEQRKMRPLREARPPNKNLKPPPPD
jgi:tetratricopeptide (TPR) repeat protein